MWRLWCARAELAFKMVETAKIKTNFLKHTHLVDHDTKMVTQATRAPSLHPVAAAPHLTSALCPMRCSDSRSDAATHNGGVSQMKGRR